MKYKCWILKESVGWVVFEMEFKSDIEALKYCEEKNDFKGTSIVERI